MFKLTRVDRLNGGRWFFVKRGLTAGVAFAVVAGCGNMPAAGTDASRVTVETSLRELSALVNGAPDDLRAAEWLEYVGYQTPAAECMASQGEIYRAPPFVSMLGGRTDAIIPDTFHSLAELPIGGTLVPSVSADIAAAAIQARSFNGEVYLDAPSESYSAALTACAMKAQLLVPGWPEPSKELNELFFQLMKDAAEAPVVAEQSSLYPPCMTELGFPVQDQVELYQRVSNGFSAFAVDYVDPHNTAAPTGTDWDRAVALEADAAAADRKCRESTHRAALDAIAPMIESFKTDNAASLDAADQFWSDVRQRASLAAGYLGVRQR